MKKRSFVYRVFISKIEKVLYLIKKSLYFAWYRHHFLIPPKVLKKYIKSFFVVLKRGGNTSNLFIKEEYLFCMVSSSFFNTS